MTKKLPKGSPLRLVKTLGRDRGSYDLYNIEGLTLGKLEVIAGALKERQREGSFLAPEILAVIGIIDEHQTINGK